MERDNDLGIAIATLRGDRSQAEVAERAGITPATWSLYERGKRHPRPAGLAKILQGLRCNRLELEETVWRVRKERLVYEERMRRKTAAAGAGEPGSEAPERPEWKDIAWPEGDPLRREVRAMLARLSAVAEEFLVFVLREMR